MGGEKKRIEKYGVSFCDDGNVQEWYGGDGYTTLWIFQNLLYCTLWLCYMNYISVKKCKRLFSCWLYLYLRNETIRIHKLIKNFFIVFAKGKYIHSHRIRISHILRWTISILTLLKIQTHWLYLYLYYQESFCAQIMTHKIHLKLKKKKFRLIKTSLREVLEK